jgi:hypothetical protein
LTPTRSSEQPKPLGILAKYDSSKLRQILSAFGQDCEMLHEAEQKDMAMTGYGSVKSRKDSLDVGQY